jgi:hypothetical protein
VVVRLLVAGGGEAVGGGAVNRGWRLSGAGCWVGACLVAMVVVGRRRLLDGRVGRWLGGWSLLVVGGWCWVVVDHLATSRGVEV